MVGLGVLGRSFEVDWALDWQTGCVTELKGEDL